MYLLSKNKYIFFDLKSFQSSLAFIFYRYDSHVKQ